MKNESPNLGLANAKSAVQVFSLKQSLAETTLSLTWLAADWNIGDALTKTVPTLSIAKGETRSQEVQHANKTMCQTREHNGARKREKQTIYIPLC